MRAFHAFQYNVKPIINHMFEKHNAKIQKLSNLPNMGAALRGLRTRWEQNNAPPPIDIPVQAEEIR
jgi:hypothetical protein